MSGLVHSRWHLFRCRTCLADLRLERRVSVAPLCITCWDFMLPVNTGRGAHA